MQYVNFIVQLIILVIVWSTALEIDCLRALLQQKGGLSPGEDKAVTKATRQLDESGKELQKTLDEAPKGES